MDFVNLGNSGLKASFAATRLLLQRGAEPAVADNRQVTPLHMAAAHTLKLVQLLVRGGAVVDVEDDRGDSPLAIAERHGKQPVVRFLARQ